MEHSTKLKTVKTFIILIIATFLLFMVWGCEKQNDDDYFEYKQQTEQNDTITSDTIINPIDTTLNPIDTTNNIITPDTIYDYHYYIFIDNYDSILYNGKFLETFMIDENYYNETKLLSLFNNFENISSDSIKITLRFNYTIHYNIINYNGYEDVQGAVYNYVLDEIEYMKEIYIHKDEILNIEFFDYDYIRM